MITIIHGEDVAKSRKFFFDEKSQYTTPISVNGQLVTITEIKQIFEGNELFSTEKYIFIEDFFSKRKKSKETEQIIEVIKQNQLESIVYFWESKNLTPAQVNNLPADRQVKQFKLPQTVFTFLDAVKPNNGNYLIQLFHQTLHDEDATFIFSMLIRQFRLLLALRESSENPIEEVKRLAPWQKGKLQKQAALFTVNALLKHYYKLYQVEFGVKTGTLSLLLEQTIDFFLLEL